MKVKLLLLICYPFLLNAQSTPPADFLMPPTSATYLRGYGDTINFDGYSSGSIITDQYLNNGAIFSGYSGSGSPVTYDYGVYSFGSVMHSDDWYDPLKVTFVDPLDSSQPMLISHLSFFNPINSEIDFIKVIIYNESDSAIASYTSTSPEWVNIDLGVDEGSYAVFDDSASTAFVVDNISFLSGGKATGIGSDPNYFSHSSIFPNPLGSSAVIAIDPSITLVNATMKINNLSGSIIREQKNLQGNFLIVDRSGLPNGIYQYKILEGYKNVAYGKLIIQ